ncbi:MAG: hypothetical protein J0J03_09685 [Leifsonia sp.]|nr:hypothetical protein [Leifsonia sp.]
MSGSDPSVTRPSSSLGGAGGGEDDACPQQFQTVLGSPTPDIVAELTLGELLDVVAIDTPRAVIATLLSGETVGAITRDIARLRRCLADGVEYEAVVVDIAGGSVTVDVHQR